MGAKLAVSALPVDLPQKITHNYLAFKWSFMLIGRDKERNMLLSALRSDKSEFIAVFGRRRVGKTYIAQESFRNSLAFERVCLAHVAQMKNALTKIRPSFSPRSRLMISSLNIVVRNLVVVFRTECKFWK